VSEEPRSFAIGRRWAQCYERGLNCAFAAQASLADMESLLTQVEKTLDEKDEFLASITPIERCSKCGNQTFLIAQNKAFCCYCYTRIEIDVEIQRPG